MRFKDFIKLTAGKIILLIILFVLGLAIFGVPINTCVLGFYKTACFVNYLGLILNLIVSYLISCIIIFAYNKLKKR